MSPGIDRLPNVNLSLTISEQFDPSGLFAGAAGAVLIGLVLWLGLAFLGLLATYWLIRLAVRHGTMDTARWQAAGMPSRRSQSAHDRAYRPHQQPPARGPRDW